MGTSYEYDSYVVTKAYNDGISNDSTLTNIIMYLRYVKPVDLSEQITFSVYYSLTTDGTTDWTLLQSYAATDFEDTEPTILTLNLVGSEIARKRHYRLKFVASADDNIILCGFERRFRVIGRSR
jgi:hypothetical protein